MKFSSLPIYIVATLRKSFPWLVKATTYPSYKFKYGCLLLFSSRDDLTFENIIFSNTNLRNMFIYYIICGYSIIAYDK